MTPSALRRCQLFAGLNEPELSQIAALSQSREFSAGDAIFVEGTPASELLIVEEGKVALQMVVTETPASAARRVTIDIITENEILGWSSLVEPYVYTLAALALQKTRILSTDGPGLRTLMEKNRDIGYAITRGLVKVIADRLAATRHVLVSERLLSP